MSKYTPVDYIKLASGLDEMREVVQAMVAGFAADGFTEREARQIVAGIFQNMSDDDS